MARWSTWLISRGNRHETICTQLPNKKVYMYINTLRPEQNGSHSVDSILNAFFSRKCVHLDSNLTSMCSQGSS